MNLQLLKYAVEVARSSSISRAAETLYVSQPFLSKAIRELEADLGIDLFNRTSKGVALTRKGEEFLVYAKDLLARADELEQRYKPKSREEYRFEVTVPISCYISEAFVAVMGQLPDEERIQVDYQEANTMTAINRVLNHESGLGIIRYQRKYEEYFLHHLESKELLSRPIWEFSYRLVVSERSPLAARQTIAEADLEPLIEISHGDPAIPAMPMSDLLEQRRKVQREIVVYERESQFSLLNALPETYMWASPTPEAVLRRNRLVQRACASPDNTYRDVLIYRRGYRMTREDKLFLQMLDQTIAALEP